MALRSAHIWLHLHNARYAAAHVEPPQLLRGGGVVILAARRRVRGEREVREVARGRERDDRRREVAARDLPSTPRYYPPSVTCGSLSLILSFSLIIGFMLARTLVQWLSHARRKRIVSKLTSQGSRERHTTAPNVRWFEKRMGANSAHLEVTFGRNVLICSNLSYCYCFEKNRSFIAYLDLPSASI